MTNRTAVVVAIAWLAAVAGAASLVVDLGRLRAALVDTVEEAVRPVSATVWLRAGSGR